jgi:hypothetical protein
VQLRLCNKIHICAAAALARFTTAASWGLTGRITPSEVGVEFSAQSVAMKHRKFKKRYLSTKRSDEQPAWKEDKHEHS